MSFESKACKALLTVSLGIVSSLTISSAGYSDSGKVVGLNATNRIPGQFIVVMKKPDYAVRADNSFAVQSFASYVQSSYQLTVTQQFSSALAGFVVQGALSEIEQLAQDPEVDFIEADQVMSINASQNNATWGIDRVDARAGRDGLYNYAATGEGVHTYIVDTGVLGTHQEFTGRMGEGFSAISDGRGPDDCNGHGTHVAGTVAGSQYGVAKDAFVHAVRVLDCNGSGSNSGVIGGVEWVAKNAELPAVANMSLGGGASAALDQAVASAIRAGVVFVVAAGNSNADACQSSPARAPAAITVGSTDRNDRRSSFSNFGRCLDIFAPGSDITSAWVGGDTRTRTISGTSMAAPHVAGAVALLLESNNNASTQRIETLLVSGATNDAISNVGRSSPNKFLYTNPEGADFPDPEPTPDPDPNPCPSCEVIFGEVNQGRSVVALQEQRTRGRYVGELKGPDGADFDLVLEQRRWFWWTEVASSNGSGSSEKIDINAGPGTYRWVVRAASGSGEFTLTVK